MKKRVWQITELTKKQEAFYPAVHKTLLGMKFGAIDLKTAHATYHDFIACTKFFMDNDLDMQNGFELVFNNDYTKLVKKKNEQTDVEKK